MSKIIDSTVGDKSGIAILVLGQLADFMGDYLTIAVLVSRLKGNDIVNLKCRGIDHF